LAAARMFWTCKVAAPVDDNAKLMPLYINSLGPPSMGEMLTGWGPEPLSMVRIKPASVLPISRFVILTFRKMERLPLTIAPGAPPEQLRAISPVRSAMPSPFTTGGSALVVQVRTDALEKPNIAKLSTKYRKNGRDMQTSNQISSERG